MCIPPPPFPKDDAISSVHMRKIIHFGTITLCTYVNTHLQIIVYTRLFIIVEFGGNLGNEQLNRRMALLWRSVEHEYSKLILQSCKTQNWFLACLVVLGK